MSDARETIFGKVCLERGWVTREQIKDCLRRRAAGESSSLSTLLVDGGMVSPDQAELLRSEIARLLESDDFEAVRRKDASLGQILVKKGIVSKEHVLEALSIQEFQGGKGGPVQRLGEILLEKGHVTFATLGETLRLHALPPRALEPAAPTPMPAPPSPPAAGATPEEALRAAAHPDNLLGKYVLIQELGRGGMGTVYKAWDSSLRRWVAVKILTGTSLGGGEDLARFLREAQTAAALQHPNIVAIYDVAQEGSRHFITMKYVEGKTLAGRKLPFRQACEIMVDVARALEHAHAGKIVHRDLKPQNVMLDAAGKPWVMDFGLAKQLSGGLNLTTPGTVVGTPSYMSPEQAAGNVTQVDPRSDVYAMGAILYELLTGQPPFRGANPVETIKMVVSRPVTPPSRIDPDVPRALEAVVLKAMEKDKGRRHQTARAFAMDLERFLGGQKITVRRPAPVRNLPRQARRNPAILILVVSAILATLLALLILLL